VLPQFAQVRSLPSRSSASSARSLQSAVQVDSTSKQSIFALLGFTAGIFAKPPRSQQTGVARFAAKRSRGKKGGGGKGRKKKEEEEEEVPLEVILPNEGLTVDDLAAALRVPPAKVITFFFMKGKAFAVNDFLDQELCSAYCDEVEADYIFEDEKTTTADERGFLTENDSEAKGSEPRYPVVTVMGHVDHGKTTLLDTLRKRSVAATEAGGITQKIGAYTVDLDGQKITFIDTPGHEAFTAMRARGAQVTDIAILVVAADDGVMPQTREAIAHARAAGVPLIVAINKIDLPGADGQETRKLLNQEGLLAEDWGGDIPMVEVSAKQNINLDSLLELIVLTAEVAELKAPVKCPAGGVIIESHIEPGRGSIATLLVQKGVLRVSDTVVSGVCSGRVKRMTNEAGTLVKEAVPSTAVQLSGFSGTPQAGDQFEVCSEKEAKELVSKRLREKSDGPVGFTGLSTDSDQTMKLALILKTDAQGSIAAVQHMFSEVKDSKYVNLRWVMTSVGDITESDIMLASTCPKEQRAMVLGFNTNVHPKAKKLAKEKTVEIANFKVIYELFDTVVAALESDLKEEEELTEKGQARVKAVFKGKDGNIAGVEVFMGQIQSGERVKVFRGDNEIAAGNVYTLRRFKEVVKSVDEGDECGFGIEGWDDWKEGDEARCYQVKMVNPEIAKKS